ncbi:hypothetical protein ACHAXR_009308 [Thalassiosira sp. AJA248-18]
MTKESTAKLLLLSVFLQGIITCPTAAAVDPQGQQQQATQIHTLMCTTESCTDSDENTPGCKQYTTPLNTCYNAKNLFPNDDSWSDLDIYDEMVMRNLKRTFYQSKDGSCVGSGDEGSDNAVPEPVDSGDSFVLPLDACVGPFGPPRPWGKFTLLDEGHDDEEVESEVLSTE